MTRGPAHRALPSSHETGDETHEKAPTGLTSEGLDGLLLIDKPTGPTSHDAVAMIRRALGGARCGHAGTLDPFASGLLVVAIGRATRLLRFLSGAGKAYEGRVRLGYATDTDDLTGRPLEEPRPVRLTEGEILSAVRGLEGDLEQVPPAYSARKHQGVPAYRLARRGAAAPRPPARVKVHWETCEMLASDLLAIRVAVSAGTYIRALARDLGSSLGCSAHLEELRRIRSDPFTLEEAIPLTADPRSLLASMRPMESMCLDLPAVALDAERAAKVRAGVAVPVTEEEAGRLEPAGRSRSSNPHPATTSEAPFPSTSPAAPTLGRRADVLRGARQGPSEPGSGSESVRWVRLLDAEGRLLGIADLVEERRDSGANDLPPGSNRQVLKPRIVVRPLC